MTDTGYWTHFIFIFITTNLVLVPNTVRCAPAYSPDLETNLRTELFSGYEVMQRPSKTVIVENIKDQLMSVSGYLTLKWNDYRLDWSDPSKTTQDYSNIKFLFSTETYVWRPAIIVENSIRALSIISDKTSPMRIISAGRIIWNPTGIYDVSCESDITYYPVDTQECTIKLTSWAYTLEEVTLVLGADSIDMDSYSTNGEWDLVEVSGIKSNDKPRGGSSFSTVTFQFRLVRRTMFHVLNTLVPVCVMAVLISMVFKLDVDSGEKIGFSLTVLLAYAVYLTMISDNIPSTSVNICYLSLYLVFVLALGGVSVILTIFVLSLHHKPADEKIPRWLVSLTNSILVFIACMKCCKIKHTPKVNDECDNLPNLKIPSKPAFEEKDDCPTELTWNKLSVIMDRVFFNIYIVMILVSTGTLIFVLFS